MCKQHSQCKAFTFIKAAARLSCWLKTAGFRLGASSSGGAISGIMATEAAIGGGVHTQREIANGTSISCSRCHVAHYIDAPEPRNDAMATLKKQRFVRVPVHTIQRTSNGRRLPFEPPPGLVQGDLDREHEGTLLFLQKQLKKDPRLKPADVTVSTEHIRECTSLRNYRGLHSALHEGSAKPRALRVGVRRRQLLFDDWAVAGWRNIVRFLNPPVERRVVLSAHDASENFFGCPCSAFTERGGVRLYYRRGNAAANRYVSAWSSDGVHNWTKPSELRFSEPRQRFAGPGARSDENTLQPDGTLVVSNFQSLNGSASPSTQAQDVAIGHLAGYQGMTGHACLAWSRDGAIFHPISSAADRQARPSTCVGSVSYLRRAADTYVWYGEATLTGLLSEPSLDARLASRWRRQACRRPLAPARAHSVPQGFRHHGRLARDPWASDSGAQPSLC